MSVDEPDRWTGTTWEDYYENGKWNRDGGNLDSLSIMVHLFHVLLGSPMAEEWNRYAQWSRDGNQIRSRPCMIHDYGCGEGDGTVFIRCIIPFAEVVGIDLWPGAIENARKRWTDRRIRWEVGDVTEPKERADIIISTTTVDHVEDVAGCIEGLREKADWVVVNWGVVNKPGHPSQDEGWKEKVSEPFWQSAYPQPCGGGEVVYVDTFQVFVWRGR